jgi:hypothetical protein
MGKINPWKVTGYKQGQNVACKVNYAEKDGYAVTIQKDNLPGFIKTANTLKAGDEILGVFVCVHNGRILLSQLFSAPRATKHQLQQTTVNWEEHLNDDDLDAAYEAQAATQRNQRLGITGEVAYQAPQTPTDFSQYQSAAATTDIPPVNFTQPGQNPDYSQFAQQQPPQQQAPDAYGQQYQGGQQYQQQQPPQPQPQQQQYQQEQYQQPQYEMPPQQQQPPANPYQNTNQNQYGNNQQTSWDNPQQDQSAGAGQNQLVPQSQFQADLLAQQQAAQQAAYGYQQPQQGQYDSGQQAQYQSGQQAQYQSGQQAQYQSGQQAQYQSGPQDQYQSVQPNTHSYGQPPAGPSAYQQSPPDQQQAYQQQPPQQAYAPPPAQQQQFQAPAQPEEQWQSPHSQVPTKRFRLRRAIDLVMPPVDQESMESLKSFKIADYDMEWLITDLEGGMRTGCIKATSEQKLSRSAALLYKGRAVGCIYGCKANPEAKPTEESLSAMLSDLEAPDAVVTLYDLPEDAALSMSALFLGYPIDNNPEMTAGEYCDFVMKWFAENNSTACLAVTVAQTKSTYLVFVHKGKFGGAFFVEEQQYTKDASTIINMFKQHPDAKIEASILNADTLNSGMRFGYSLSMARQKRSGF